MKADRMSGRPSEEWIVARWSKRASAASARSGRPSPRPG